MCGKHQSTSVGYNGYTSIAAELRYSYMYNLLGYFCCCSCWFTFCTVTHPRLHPEFRRDRRDAKEAKAPRAFWRGAGWCQGLGTPQSCWKIWDLGLPLLGKRSWYDDVSLCFFGYTPGHWMNLLSMLRTATVWHELVLTRMGVTDR